MGPQPHAPACRLRRIAALTMAIPASDPFDYESALEACARGERFALRAIYERESRWLLGVVLRIVRNRETAQDVLQDAFVLIWQRAARYQRALGSGRGWIYTVVRHRALDEARRVVHEVAVGDELEALADARDPTPTSEPIDGLERCLAALDDKKRACVIEAFVEGRTHEEIAAKLAAPLGSVKTWIRRGLIALKECLS